MSAPLFRSISITSRKYEVIHSRYSILLNSLRHLKTQSVNNHNKNDHNKSESAQKSFLTYKLAIAGILGCGLGYTLYKWKNDISNKLFNYEFFHLPKVYAASIFNSDISQNRNKYNFIADVVEISAPSVVYIEIKDQKRMDFFTGKSATTSNGSGFIVSEDGLILTNAHVVINKPNTLVKVRLQDGSTYIGRVEDVDLRSDLATVRIDKNNLPVMKLGSSANIKPGEFVVAIGSPLALSNTITSGVVSSANRQSEELGLLHKHMEYIQTDAAITFGNSGGPLVNLSGEAIGINAMKVTAGISFAIPIDYAKEFLKKAKERRNNKDNGKENSVHSRRRYIGITMLTLTPEMLFELQQLVDTIPSNLTHGVLVWKVTVESPAYVGGLKPGDIITYVNKKPVKEASQIHAFVEEPGPLTVTIIRGGKTFNIRIDPEDI